MSDHAAARRGSDPLDAPARRGLLLASAAAATAGLATVTAAPASAAPVRAGDGVRTPSAGSPAGAPPVVDSLSSAPLSGYVYRFVTMYDFFPLVGTAQRTWGGSGTYAGGASGGGPMRATIPIPAGALLRDVEFYVYNNSAGAVNAAVYAAVAGAGFITQIGSVSVPAGPSIQRARVAISATSNGPFPPSSLVMVGVDTPSNGSVQINGARVGFSGGATMSLLPTPVRAYDSRSGSRFTAGSTRTITLPTTVAAPRTVGVLVNVLATGATGAGYLKAWAGDAATPSASALNYVAGASVANMITLGVSASRQVKVFASAPTHVVLDVTVFVS